MIRALTLLAVSVITSACVSQPEIYAPPAQRKPLDQEILVRAQPMLDMSDPTVERYFVADIAKGVQSSPWRWTGPRPSVRVTLKSTSNLRYHMEFTLPEVTFKDTGPVTITYFVNHRVLDKVKYDTAGNKVFDKAVPSGFLKPMDENVLAAEVDKPWLSKGDGRRLGLILSRIGLQ